MLTLVRADVDTTVGVRGLTVGTRKMSKARIRQKGPQCRPTGDTGGRGPPPPNLTQKYFPHRFRIGVMDTGTGTFLPVTYPRSRLRTPGAHFSVPSSVSVPSCTALLSPPLASLRRCSVPCGPRGPSTFSVLLRRGSRKPPSRRDGRDPKV